MAGYPHVHLSSSPRDSTVPEPVLYEPARFSQSDRARLERVVVRVIDWSQGRLLGSEERPRLERSERWGGILDPEMQPVHLGWLEAWPAAALQPLEQGLEREQSLYRTHTAMARPVDKELAQQVAGTRRGRRLAIGL